MPLFRYSATDKSGAEKTGTIEAPTPEDAKSQLQAQGLTVGLIMKAPDTVTPPAQRPNPPKTVHQAAPAPKSAAPQAARPQATITRAPATQTPNASRTSKPSTKTIVRTKISSDKDLMLLFSQLAKQIKAGMGPAAALDDLKLRVPNHMRDSIDEASKSATAGGSISDAFERYPDLYPENVVAMTRAAEAGGFLEEAFELLSDQSQNAHTFSRTFWWVRPMIVNAFIALPLAYLFFSSVVRAWKIVDSQNDPTPDSTISAMLSSAFMQLLWPIGPITLVLYFGTWWLYRYMRTPKMRLKRHTIIFKSPTFGSRAKHEGLAVFSWIMSKLSNAGISPKRSWEMAAASVPNMAVKERLERIGSVLTGNEKLSEAVVREELFPQEYGPIIATAEHTGDMPAAFAQLAKLSKGEFEASQVAAQQKSGSMGRVGCMLVSGILFIMLMFFMYYRLLPAILSGLEP